MSGLTRLGLLLVSNVVALWVAERLIHGFHADAFWPTLVIAGAVLGILDWLVKPILTLLTLPFVLLTLGLLLIVINAAMLGLTALVVAGLHIDSIGAALGAAIIVSVVSWVVTTILGVRSS